MENNLKWFFFGGIVTSLLNIGSYYVGHKLIELYDSSRQEPVVETKSELEQRIKMNQAPCRQFLANYYRILGTSELREVVCRDISLYQNNDFDSQQALENYTRITNSMEE
jgi:hypothetical protein